MAGYMIALLVALGGGAWSYNKIQRTTGGGNIKLSLTMGAVAGAILFLFILILLSFMPDNN
jgi:hypothetical protein